MTKHLYTLYQFISILLIASVLIGCGPSAAELAALDFTPLSRGDWPVSTPAE